MDKVEPERLRRSIPLFKPWISGTAWDHWEEFLESALPKLADIDDVNVWPLSVIKAASDHNRMEENVQEDENGEGARVLEEMLDEERVAVEVRNFVCCYKVIIFKILVHENNIRLFIS